MVEGPLPRGRHDLSDARVAEVQRGRFLVSVTELLADRPLGSITTAEVARHARASLSAFYAVFTDKEDCALAAYARFSARLAEQVLAARSPEATLREHVDALVGAYFRALQADPVSARAFLVQLDAAMPEARRRRRAALGAFVSMLDAGYADARAADPGLAPLPPETHATIIHSMRRLACEALEPDGDVDLLRQIAPMRELTLALYSGTGAEDGGALACEQEDVVLT